jgi:ABC-type transport system involved in multi-copper enzyme maturation permease subunit
VTAAVPVSAGQAPDGQTPDGQGQTGPGIAGARVTLVGVIRSEWIKLRSLRSTWWSLFAAVVITVGMGALFSWLRTRRVPQVAVQRPPVGPPAGVRIFDTAQISLRGVLLAQLAVGVLGVLVITGEYATGMIRSSLSAAPRRYQVLVAKALVFAAVIAVVTTVAAFVAFFVGQAILTALPGHQESTLSTPGALRAIIAASTYLVLLGLMAIGIGFLIRNTAGAITTLFGIVLVAPILVATLPDPYSTDVAKFLPLNALTQATTTLDLDPALFSPWAGVGIVAAWAGLAIASGLVVLLRRDA